MTDPYQFFADIPSNPSTHGAPIVTSDTVDLTTIPKGLYIGTAGNIAMIGENAPANATGVTFVSVAAGSILPFRPRRVLATGTTASNIIALY